MVDQKVTALAALGALTTDDLFYVVDDPSGTPISKKLAVSVLDARYLVEANNLSDLPNAGTARGNLGVAIGSDVQAYDAGLADVAGLAVTDGNFIVGDGANWVAESGATARTSLGVGIGDSPTFASVTLTGTIEIPTTTNTVGQIIQNSNRVFHTYGSNSLFIGMLSGNFTLTGDGNIGVGVRTLDALTDGNYNLAIGTSAGSALTSGDDNVAIGISALLTAQTSNANVAIGSSALRKTTTGTLNVGIGGSALYNNVGGSRNMAIGGDSMFFLTGGSDNVGIGSYACTRNVTGSNNVAVGSSALRETTAAANVGIGASAGHYNQGGGK